MRSTAILFLAMSLAVLAGERKPLPGQAGNDDIELVASLMIDRNEIQQAVGADLGAGYVVVKMKVTPKTEKPLRFSPDDFTIICRKDGQRVQALSPGQIAGKGGELVVKAAAQQPGGYNTQTNGPIWGGATMRNPNPPRKSTDSSDSKSSDAKSDDKKETSTDADAKKNDNPLLKSLEAKALPDKETLDQTEGLLYFTVDGKFKQKDLAIIYRGPAGHLTIEFVNPK